MVYSLVAFVFFSLSKRSIFFTTLSRYLFPRLLFHPLPPWQLEPRPLHVCAKFHPIQHHPLRNFLFQPRMRPCFSFAPNKNSTHLPPTFPPSHALAIFSSRSGVRSSANVCILVPEIGKSRLGWVQVARGARFFPMAGPWLEGCEQVNVILHTTTTRIPPVSIVEGSNNHLNITFFYKIQLYQ